jgi:cyclopropane fatty-acyl-phospholipid synthase-like methyltransferase
LIDWQTFWADPPRYFSNAALRKAHFRILYSGLVEQAGVHPGSSLLDFGCGDADLAPLLAESGVTVFLFDTSPHYQVIARRCASLTPGVEAVDEAFLDDRSLPPLDTVLASSVVQYLDSDTLSRFLHRARTRLTAEGCLVLADVPERSSLVRDTVEVLTDALRHGYFRHALASLVTRLFSAYGSNLRESGLRRYSVPEMMSLLEQHGFTAKLARRNFAVKASRRTYIARRTT